MKKPKNFTYLLYIIILIGLFLVGREVIQNSRGLPYDNATIFCLVCFVISFVATGILYELGHLFGALICGYEIVSFNIFGLTFVNANHKISIRYESYNGFTGETKIAPKKDKANPTFFFLSGFLLVLIVNIALLLVALLGNELNENAPVFYYGAILFVTLSVFISLYSIVPINVDNISDGMYLRYIRKGKIEEFNNLCVLQKQIICGERLTNIDAITDFNAGVSMQNFLAFNSALYEENYQRAQEIIDLLYEHSECVVPAEYNSIIPNKLLVLLKTSTKEEFLNSYNTLPSSYRSYITKLESLECCRANLLISGIIFENEVAVNNCLRKYRTFLDKIKSSGIKEQEEKLANDYLKEIQEAHPDWNVAW
ncbi:MAG: hypothetical protein ACI311_01190 [Bacilli bacterium]